MEVVLGQMTFLEKVVSSLPSESLILLSLVMAFSEMASLVMASSLPSVGQEERVQEERSLEQVLRWSYFCHAH